jgi:hypothetical protein
MKKIVVLFALSIIIFSCGKESSKTETNAPDSTGVTSGPETELGNSVWVNARYLETLEKTKSPLKAKVYADTVMVSFNATADTANMVWNFHEGSAYKVRNDGKLELFNTYEAKPAPEYVGSVDASTLKLGSTTFRKVEAIDFVEKKFWIGKYNYNGKTIELRADNQLSGLDDFESYRVWVDYVTTQTDIDLIELGKKDSEQTTTYGYKFEGNEIVFYNFIWQEDGVMGKAGKEAFRWKRL